MKKLTKNEIYASISFTSSKIALAGIAGATLGLVTKNPKLKVASTVVSFGATIVEKVTDKLYEKTLLGELDEEEESEEDDFDDDFDNFDLDDDTKESSELKQEPAPEKKEEEKTTEENK